MVSQDSTIPRKNKGKNQKKNMIVIRLMHPHQKVDTLMVLTALT